MALALIPGIDITQGQVGGFSHGEIDSKHLFGDPVTAAERWISQGARWLHVTDLDAMSNRGSNTELVAKVLHAARGRADVVLAGGIRDEATLQAAIATGARQVILDSAALADLDFVSRALKEHAGRVAVGIVAHGGDLWAPGSVVDGADVFELLTRVDAFKCPAYLIDDVDSRGMRKESGRETLVEACGIVRGAVIAAGGITRLEDLHALATLGLPALTGIVVDRALYTDAFTLAEAEAAIEPRFDPYIWAPPQP